MSAPRFFYTSEIDTKIPNLIKDTLHTDVISCHKVAEGEENHVFMVTTPEKKVVLRILGTPFWAGVEKLAFLNKTLQENKIPFPQLVHYSLTDEYFPYGFMITEFIDGINGKDAIEQGKISFTEFHKKLFQLLRKLHAIKNEQFNFLNEEGFDSVIDFKLNQMTWCFDQLTEQKDVFIRKDDVQEIIKKFLSPLTTKIAPVLIHYDPTPSNCIYTPEGHLVLVDWDSAASECFMRDIAWLTYWESDGASSAAKENRREILWKLFLEAYQDYGFTIEELQRLEQIYHLCITVELLPYYLVSQKNIKGYEDAKKRLFRSLQNII